MVAVGTVAYYSNGNRLLDALPKSDLFDLKEDIEVLSLAAHHGTHSANEAIHHVDFPIDAVLSVVATLRNGDSIEVGTVGNEGFVESDAALGHNVSSRTSFCQVTGRIGRMSIDRFERIMCTSGPFAQLMHRNVRATLFSAQQFVACNSQHSVLQRCARWLSMTADRVGSTEFVLTHDFLAIMLGVRRAGVSEAADGLQKMGAIQYMRGRVVVVDMQLLNATACECYAACKDAFASSLLS